jgi:6-pyruvoyltetrahydropterin/6-carboxytetrahydropterin synthase
MKVCRCFEFDAAHKLPEYEGKCANLHGHHWKVEIELTGDIDNKTGMVLDFNDLKTIINPMIDKLDHHYLNDMIPNPTAENIVMWFRWELAVTSINAKLSKIRVYETNNSYAEWERGGL